MSVWEWVVGSVVAVTTPVAVVVKWVLGVRTAQRKLLDEQVRRLDLKLEGYREALEDDVERLRVACSDAERRAVIAEARAEAAEARAESLAQEVRILRSENVALRAQLATLEVQAAGLQHRQAEYERANHE